MMSEGASKAKSRSAPEKGGDGYSSEEEELVYITFDTVLDSDFMQPETPFKLIGIDEEQPILQLGSQVYAGTWKDTIGTAVFLEEDRTAQNRDPVFTKNPAKMLRFLSKSRKNLAMSRVFINPKDRTNLNGADQCNKDAESANCGEGFRVEQAGCSYSQASNSAESAQHLSTETDGRCDESGIPIDAEDAYSESQYPAPIHSVIINEDQPSCSYGPYTIPKRER